MWERGKDEMERTRHHRLVAVDDAVRARSVGVVESSASSLSYSHRREPHPSLPEKKKGKKEKNIKRKKENESKAKKERKVRNKLTI